MKSLRLCMRTRSRLHLQHAIVSLGMPVIKS